MKPFPKKALGSTSYPRAQTKVASSIRSNNQTTFLESASYAQRSDALSSSVVRLVHELATGRNDENLGPLSMRREVTMSLLLLLSSAALLAHGFVPSPPFISKSGSVTKAAMPQRTWQTRVKMSMASELPTQAARQQAMYDMVYVERLPEEQQMTSGLFLPTKENPRMHVCKVVSLGHGREGESGHVTPNEAVKPGDLVYVKDPYGIGPRDDEFAGKKFSFVRYSSICGIIPDSQGYEDAARKAGKMQEEVDRATGAAGNIGF